jgi:outer membrane protein assembly factor BamA
MRLPIPAFLVALAAACLALPACAQVQILKPQSIRFDGTQEYTQAELLGVTDIKKGQAYTGDYFNQASQKLMSSGMFERVGFKFDGVDLIFLMVDSPDLYPVQFDNLPLPADAELDAKLRQAVPLYHGKVPSEGTLLYSVKHALEAMLTEQGTPATVAAIPAGVDLSKKATAMKFRIESPTVRVGTLSLKGYSDGLPPETQSKITAAAGHASVVFSRAATADNLERYFEVNYRNLGYAGVHVHAIQEGKPVAASDSIRVPFTMEIQPGHTYKLGQIQFSPEIPVSYEEVAKLSGSRDHYTPDNIYLAIITTNLLARLRAKGYMDSHVTPHVDLNEATNVANYMLHADLGPVYHLGLFKFDTSNDDLRSQLMRHWQMMPGDPFDEAYVANFILAAQQNDPALQRALTGIKTNYDMHADQETHEMNLIIHLEKP